MADNKRWFKVWTSILSDPDFDDLPNELIGVWVRLGALIAKHGEKGQITLSLVQLEKRANIKKDMIKPLNLLLDKINVCIKVHDNSSCSVIMKNWLRYQVDSTGYERLKRYREKQNDNGVKNKKKIKIKKKIKKVLIGKIVEDFNKFWNLYPKRIGKAKAIEAWQKIDLNNGLLEEIMAAVKKQSLQDDWLKENGQFVPHPATWLNQNRWEDEIQIKEKRPWQT